MTCAVRLDEADLNTLPTLGNNSILTEPYSCKISALIENTEAHRSRRYAAVDFWGTTSRFDSREPSECSESLQTLREHLSTKGFTSAPNSGELQRLICAMPEEQLKILQSKRSLPGLHSSDMFSACLQQLKQVLHAEVVAIGLYKARFRTDMQSAVKIHKDDVLITEDDVRMALFPAPSDATHMVEEILENYTRFYEDLGEICPKFEFPRSPEALGAALAGGADISDLAREVISAIQSYNARVSSEDALVFDNVNVWIPKDVKQLVILPLEQSLQIDYPFTSSNISEVHRLQREFYSSFDSFAAGTALIFLGQCVLHQASVGPGFEFGGGSLEGRYLTLAPKRVTHRGSLRNCIAAVIPDV